MSVYLIPTALNIIIQNIRSGFNRRLMAADSGTGAVTDIWAYINQKGQGKEHHAADGLYKAGIDFSYGCLILSWNVDETVGNDKG